MKGSLYQMEFVRAAGSSCLVCRTVSYWVFYRLKYSSCVDVIYYGSLLFACHSAAGNQVTVAFRFNNRRVIGQMVRQQRR